MRTYLKTELAPSASTTLTEIQCVFRTHTSMMKTILEKFMINVVKGLV